VTKVGALLEMSGMDAGLISPSWMDGPGFEEPAGCRSEFAIMEDGTKHTLM
jgi:hypothetical protein